MRNSVFFLSGSIILVLLISCGPTKSLTTETIEDLHVPAYMDVSSLSPSRNTQWALNGEKVRNYEGKGILFTRSGRYTLVGKFFIDGQMDSVKYSVKALPPLDNCQVAIHTSKGTMVAHLSHYAPRHTDHFEALIERGYYDSLTFHRIVPGFVVQGGDGQDSLKKEGAVALPLNDLSPEFHPELLHYKGALAMARMPDEVNPEKASSPDQFYLVQGSPLDEKELEDVSARKGVTYKSYQRERYLENGGAPQLDGEYTVFGYLTHGLEVLDSLSLVPTNSEDMPIDPIFMAIKKVK